MKNILMRAQLKRVLKLWLLLMMGVSMSACSKSWEEEVQLHNGGTIIVKRSVERGGRHEIGQRPPIKMELMSFVLPDTNEHVVWKTEFSADIGLADFQPLLLDVFHGNAYLVTSPVGCLSYNKWGRPNPPYIIFKYENKTWKRIAIDELPAELSTPNVMFSSPDNEVEKLDKRYVTVEMVRRANSELTQPEYKSILRKPMGVRSGCPELVRTADGWVSPNGGRSPIPIGPHNLNNMSK